MSIHFYEHVENDDNRWLVLGPVQESFRPSYTNGFYLSGLILNFC